MKLVLAKEEHSQAVARYFEAHQGEATQRHPELDRGELLEEKLRHQELAVVVAFIEQRPVGAGVAVIQNWNQSLEVSTITVSDIEGRGKVKKALFTALCRLGSKKYGLVFHRVETKPQFRRVQKLGAQCWGVHPTPGARTLDEASLIMGFPHPGHEKKRIEPPPNAITESAFGQRVRREIADSEMGVPYPKSYPVGRPRGTGAPMISGRVWPTYHSKSNHIQIENAAGAHPVEIIKEFKQKVGRKGVEDLRLTVPVNKERACRELMAMGFRPVAYLPAWYLRGAHRFDCVQLNSGLAKRYADKDSFMGRAVSRILSELKF